MYLGIDVGTPSVKSVLIDRNQSVIATVSENLKISKRKLLYSEQNPNDWWCASLKTITSIRKSKPIDFCQLKSIGLTGQMHGAVCLDKKEEILYPAILSDDGRSYKECDYLNKHHKDFEQLGGNLVMPGFTAPKLLWLGRNKPDIFNKIDKVVLPKDYLRYKLTGEFATDMSDASGTLWLDIKKRKWSETTLSACDLKESNMAQLYEGTECTGYLLPSVQKTFGIKKPIKVIAGASDNAAGALSIGSYTTGQAMVSLGTSGVYFSPTSLVTTNTKKGLHTFCHAIKEKWHQMGVILSAGSALSWWSNVCEKDKEAILDSLSKQYNDKDIPLFLPYLSGERTPCNNPFARASFIGMTHNTTSIEMVQSVLEGVTFAIADCEDTITGTHTKINSVSVIGGGAKYLYWGKIIASALVRDLFYHENSSIGPMFGAARLALYEDNELSLAQVFTQPKIVTVIKPDPKLQQQLHRRRSLYHQSYKNLKEIFKLQ